MAENYGYGYGGYRDEYDDEYDDADVDYEAGYDDAADDDAEHLDAADDDDRYEDDTDVLTGAVDEPVNEVLDDPAVNESASYQRIRRMKRSRRLQARARREGKWIPPDLTRFGSPVFGPVAEPHAPGPARPMAIDLSEIGGGGDVLRQVFMTPLLSGPELARALDLDEDLVLEAAQALQQEGLLRSVSVGCLLRPTARYWVAPVHVDTTPRSDLEQAVLSWHSDAGIGSLLRYSLLRIESINQVAVRYGVDGWALEGVAWAERDAVQAIGLYNRKQSPQVKSLVYFVWVSQWDTEREISERLMDLPEAVSRITEPGLSGSVALIGADRWAVTKALPMAIESLSAGQVEPADLAAWTYAAGWLAASGASLLDCAVQRFRPTLAPARLDRFVWPRSQRSLGKTHLESIINSCPWTRPDSRTLYRTLKLVGEHTGASIAHYGALAGESDSELITRKRLGTLLDLGLAREAGRVGVANLGTPDRPEVLSARGRGQLRYRVSLGPNGEEEPAKRQAGESKEDHARRTANGAFRIMLDHGELSYREIVRRSGVGKLEDRFADRLGHEDVLVDLLGRLKVLGYEVAPASRARTVNAEGCGIDPDGMLYCTSPVGAGYHYFELELSHLTPGEIETRLQKYAQRHTSYPLAVVGKTDLGARHFDRIGQRLGVPVVATSLHRLRTIGFSGPAWLHQGQEAFVTPVPGPPRPATPPPRPAAL